MLPKVHNVIMMLWSIYLTCFGTPRTESLHFVFSRTIKPNGNRFISHQIGYCKSVSFREIREKYNSLNHITRIKASCLFQFDVCSFICKEDKFHFIETDYMTLEAIRFEEIMINSTTLPLTFSMLSFLWKAVR